MKKEKIGVKVCNIDELIFYKEDIVNVMLESLKINFPHQIFNGEERYQKLLLYYMDGKAEVLIALRDTEFLGYIWFFKKDKRRIHLNELAVKQSENGKGVGTLLMNYLEQYVKTKYDIKEIELFCMESNSRALEFYEKNGFCSEKRLLVKNQERNNSCD